MSKPNLPNQLKCFFYVKTLSILILMLPLSSSLYSQGKQLESVLRNSKGEAISFAHIYLTKSTGTIANAHGAFRLYIPDGIASDQLLTITAIGYKTREISIQNLPNVIVMAEDQRMLNEVVVLPIDYARRLVRGAIAKIPENYPSFQERHTGFLREQTSWVSDPDSLLYVVEATMESTKVPYKKSSRDGEVKILKSRRYNTRGLDSVFTKIVAGTHHTHRFDEVAKRNLFLKNDEPYSFEIEDTLRSQGQNIFKIRFTHKNESPHGSVFIEEETKAFVRFEVKYPSNFPLSYLDDERISFEYMVDYFKAPDSLWRFLKSDYQTHFKKKGDTLILKSSYISTSHEKNSANIPYLERFQPSSAILENEEVYDSSFWENFNIMVPDASIERLFQRGSPSIEDPQLSQELDKKIKLFDALSRLRFSYGFQLTAVEVAPYSAAYTTPELSINESQFSSSNKWTYAYSASILYRVLPKVWAGYSSEATFDNSGISAHDLTVFAEFNLNPKGRPVFLSPVFKIGWQRTNVFLDTYGSEEEFQVAGKKFDSGQTEVYLSQRDFRIRPGVRIAIERSRRTTYFLGASYNQSLQSTTGFYFRERDEFFLLRKKQFLRNNREGLEINNSQDLLTKTLTAEIGILIGI